MVDKFFKMNAYIAGSYDKPEDFQRLDAEISKYGKAGKKVNRLFYLALPPTVYEGVTLNLRQQCMAKG